MRCTCATPRETCSPDLIENLTAIGVPPIVTPHVIRAVYDGPNRNTAQAIIDLFEKESCHDIVVDGLEQNKHTKGKRKKAKKR